MNFEYPGMMTWICISNRLHLDLVLGLWEKCVIQCFDVRYLLWQYVLVLTCTKRIEEFFWHLGHDAWCMMHGQIFPIESVTQSPTHSRIHIKDVGWFNLSILNSLPNLIPRPFKNLQNVWHQCYPSSPSLSQWWLSVPWWKRQSNHHSWREVSPTSIRWYYTANCTYVLCISLCWTLNTWFAISPLLWYEGAAISY